MVVLLVLQGKLRTYQKVLMLFVWYNYTNA